MERVGHRCICGCEKEIFGSRRYFPGHKPKLELTPEEKTRRKSEAAKKAWDKRGRSEVELRPCACGCGEQVSGTWAWGHHSRVQNISKRDDVRELRRQSFVRMHEEGKLEPWNRGLTAETDERVAANLKNVCEEARSEKGRADRAERLTQLWKDGKFVPLRGPAHPQWKGGTSSITQRIRGSEASGKLYWLWRRPIMERDGFKCRRCEKPGPGLVVHHDQERFAEIVRKMIFTLFGKEALERELTFEEGTHVVAAVLDYHVRERVSGITLCSECHEREHERNT